MDYDSVHVLSTPKIANALVENPDVVAVYEFHSSNMTVVEQELKELEAKVAQVGKWKHRLEEIHKELSFSK